jgi:hypothetical protein
VKKIQFKFWVAISTAMKHLVAWTRVPGFVKRLALVSCAIASILLTDSASRAIDFNFYYTDAAGSTGSSPYASAVPEPASAMLLLLGLVIMRFRCHARSSR